MRKSVTMRLDQDVLNAARDRAKADNRTLTNYIETLMRRDLASDDGGPSLSVVAPPGIRQSVPVPLADETEDERARREEVFHAILNASGH